MKFINKGGPFKIRIGEISDCYWKTIRKNDVLDLPLQMGLKLGLTKLKTTEGKIGDKKVETKQIELVKYTNDSDFYKELIAVNGIGPKTAEDIVDFGTKEKLIEIIRGKHPLPFRDDVELKLRKKYG